MFTKTLIAALVLASTTIALANHASAGPEKQVGAPTGETTYIDHASKNWDGGGY
jgi:hypothetical protein